MCARPARGGVSGAPQESTSMWFNMLKICRGDIWRPPKSSPTAASYRAGWCVASFLFVFKTTILQSHHHQQQQMLTCCFSLSLSRRHRLKASSERGSLCILSISLLLLFVGLFESSSSSSSSQQTIEEGKRRKLSQFEQQQPVVVFSYSLTMNLRICELYEWESISSSIQTFIQCTWNSKQLYVRFWLHNNRQK